MPTRLAPNLPKHKAWPAVCTLFVTAIAALGALETRPVAAQPLTTPPVAAASLRPMRAYVDMVLRGSASFFDLAGHREGTSRYRWVVNGSAVLGDTVAQTILLPLDGDLVSTDGEAPAQGPGLAFVPAHPHAPGGCTCL
jgi:hypothetical protein